MKRLFTPMALFLVLGLAAADVARSGTTGAETAARPMADTAVATFAGGCFWCMEHPFDELDGVISTTSGYTGGHQAMPTYREVSAGGTGHAEAVEVVYDPSRVSYERLLDVFWHNVDPTVRDRQFCDVGHQYRTAIFYHDAAQKAAAEASRDALAASGVVGRPIVTEIVAASDFYPAEGYHQDFYRTHPVKYKLYRYRCGRDQRLEELWGDTAGGHPGAGEERPGAGEGSHG